MGNTGQQLAFGITRRAARFLAAFFRCRDAAIAPLMVLMMIPIVGGIAYAVELGSWTYVQRSMQNAADSAALAAATINSGTATTGSTSLHEAQAAASKFGFINGANGASVTAGTTTCPTGVTAGSTCYEAIITNWMARTFSAVLGLNGRQAISARAVAVAAGGEKVICLWTFTSLQTNGTPRIDLPCTALSNGNMTCTGGGLNAPYAAAGGTVSGPCADPATGQNHSGQSPLPADPYAPLASNIPSNALSNCTGPTPFPQLARSGSKWSVVSKNQISSGAALSGKQTVLCGDIQLTGDVTLTGNSTIIIENGRLDLNGHTIKTDTNAGATIVFSGDPTNTAYSHYPSSLNGGGAIDIAAPTTGPWSNIAIYQDPALTKSSTVSFTYTGNDPAWMITGVIYLPHASATFRGVVSKASNGTSCTIFVADIVDIRGTGQILADATNCPNAPSLGPTTREKLVL